MSFIDKYLNTVVNSKELKKDLINFVESWEKKSYFSNFREDLGLDNYEYKEWYRIFFNHFKIHEGDYIELFKDIILARNYSLDYELFKYVNEEKIDINSEFISSYREIKKEIEEKEKYLKNDEDLEIEVLKKLKVESIDLRDIAYDLRSKLKNQKIFENEFYQNRLEKMTIELHQRTVELCVIFDKWVLNKRERNYRDEQLLDKLEEDIELEI